MKLFKLYEHPTKGIEAVKQGWSWPGFFFVIFWSLFKKLWVVSIAIIAFLMVLQFGLEMSGASLSTLDNISTISGIVISIYLGMSGNQLREKNLKSRGFECLGEVSASNPDAALTEYSKSKEAAKIVDENKDHAGEGVSSVGTNS